MNTFFSRLLQPEGDFAQKSETGTVYQDNHAARPVIHKLRDHSSDVQPEGALEKRWVSIFSDFLLINIIHDKIHYYKNF